MNSKTYHGEYTLRHWINLMLKRNIILPDYQRCFVWSNQDVERLIHSFKTGQFIQPITIARMNVQGNGTNIILDGQQRLTSILLYVLGIYPLKDKFNLVQSFATGDNTPFVHWFELEVLEYRNYCNANILGRKAFCNTNKEGNLSLFDKELMDYYKNVVYRFRNRYAHNLTSYQLNIPTFTQLASHDICKNNHFRMFSTLILLDGIFMTLFDKFLVYKVAHHY